MKRVCIIFIITAIISGLFAPPAAVAGFDDISDQATQTAASLLQNLGIVAGYGDGKFHPHDKLTRAQFCKMAVLLSGMQDVTAYEGFTIFPDVRANHWGRGYINAAVRAVKIVTGFPDGTFKPDISVSYAQAVTTLVRLLGYSDSDVGLNWPRGYMDKAGQIGLTKGLSLGANDAMTRGQAAQLFYNAIFATNKSGKKYCDELGFSEQKVIIMRQDVTSPDGRHKGLVTIGGDGFYPYRSEVAVEEGWQGTLLVDMDGYVLSWTPDAQTKREITVRTVGPMSVIGSDGNKIDNIPSNAVVYISGEKNTWDKCWIDIPSGLALRFFYSATGAIDYIFLYQPSDDGDVKIIYTEPAAGQNPLPSLDIGANAQVLKNGVAASWADLRLYDVLIYNAEANTVNASDFRITGIYENALPNREAPDEVITLGGKNFKLLPNVRSKLAERKPGEALTFLFTPDGRVADIRSERLPAYQPGVTSGDSSVTLYNGIIISGNTQLPAGYGDGTPVLACMREPGELSLQAIVIKGSAELDIKDMKAGAASIAPYAVFFDLSGAGGRAVSVERAALPDTVNAADVISVSFDSGGRADLILLRNVSGDAWMYGFTTSEQGRYSSTDITDENGNVVDTVTSYVPNRVIMENQYGTQSYNDYRSLGKTSGSNIYGVAVGTNGSVIASKACVRVNNIRRSDFSGNTSLTVSGVSRPIPDDLMVYVQATKEYISITDARIYSNNFTVFLDKPAAEGGKPRFIVAL